MTTICTGFSPSGYRQYGAHFLESFDRNWPADVRLLCFVEETPPGPIPRGAQRSLWACKGMREFLTRNGSHPRANGREPIPGKWAPKHVEKGYYYKFDAVKFSRQCFIPECAADELPDGEVLAWFDADVDTFQKVPPGFVDGLLGTHDLCYLGRTNMHTELGFWAVRLNFVTRTFLADLAGLYREDAIFRLPEWHSAYAFDYCRKQRMAPGVLKELNLTPRGYGHVWFQSPLGRYTDHLKGDRRKADGRSMERAG